jgi:hypothetical protein
MKTIASALRAVAFVYPIRVFQNERPRARRGQLGSSVHREERASHEDALAGFQPRLRSLPRDRIRSARSLAVGDEFEHRLQLLLSIADPLEHGADKDIASIISISRCFDLPSRSIARRVTSAARCRLSLSALLTVW